MEKLSKVYKRLFYSERSYFLMNHYTLRIKDIEIRRHYNEALASNFNQLFKSTLTINIIYAILRVVLFIIYPSPSYAGLFGTSIHLIFVSIWGIIKWRKPLYAPPVVFFYALAWCIFTNLSWRDQLPWFLLESDRTMDENSIFVTLLITHSLNYNNFLTSLFLMPPIILCSYYSQLVAQVQLYTDPYTLEPLDETGKSSFVENKLTEMIMMVSLVSVHHYLIQRDLSIIVIEKQMIKR